MESGEYFQSPFQKQGILDPSSFYFSSFEFRGTGTSIATTKIFYVNLHPARASPRGPTCTLGVTLRTPDLQQFLNMLIPRKPRSSTVARFICTLHRRAGWRLSFSIPPSNGSTYYSVLFIIHCRRSIVSPCTLPHHV